MLRVGFILTTDTLHWTGGLNYIANLLQAIVSRPDRQIEPVLIMPPDLPTEHLSGFPPVEIIRTFLAAEGTWVRMLRKLLERGIGRDLIMEHYLRQLKIDLLSHSDQLGWAAKTPTIGWIPDFQHVRLPNFFSEAERRLRNRGYRRLVNNCTIIVLSSADAQNDLRSFSPTAVGRSQVLHFVAGLSTLPPPNSSIKEKYKLFDKFFYLPNQFWVHKNHRVLVDAIGILKEAGCNLTVVCTGQTHDRREPRYFEELRAYIEQKSLADNIRILGLVPYGDVRGFFDEALAIINPSQFEGWSTSVEEAKSAGKLLVLSDIPVHREQAPERVLFFEPNRPEALASALLIALNEYSINKELVAKQSAALSLRTRFEEFAKDYEAIVCKAVRLKKCNN